MEITKLSPDSGCGIYAKSEKIKNWREAKAVAKEMCEWLDANNGTFDGEYPRAFAVAHAQVIEHNVPLRLFVVAKDLVVPEKPIEKDRQNLTNGYFEAQAIFNCEILEAPEIVRRKVPERKVEKGKDGKVSVSVGLVEKEVNNKITVPEGCMSFPHRTTRNTERYFRIKVRYQYITKGFLGETKKTFTGWVEGLKAHIIQHEVQHFEGKNMHFK